MMVAFNPMTEADEAYMRERTEIPESRQRFIGRRLALLPVASVLLTRALRLIPADPHRVECISDPLPDDVRVVGVHWDEAREVAVFMLESEAFVPVIEGALIPEVPAPTLRVIYD